MTMIKLYGAPISNYYNMVKVALIEKGIDCEGGALTSSNAKPFCINNALVRL